MSRKAGAVEAEDETEPGRPMTSPHGRTPLIARISISAAWALPRRARHWTAVLLSLLLPVGSRAEGPGHVELTVDHPVAISLEPLQSSVTAGSRSFLLLRFTIPEGIWIGAARRDVRAPGPTVLEMETDSCLRLDKPRWPEPRVEGIPVNLGATRVYTGRIQVVIPFEALADCAEGKHRVAVRITYTPGLNAGHLTPHVRERYETAVEVRPPSASGPAPSPPAPARPQVEPASGQRIERSATRLPEPLGRMVFRISEDSGLATFLHGAWEDHGDHGKRIDGVMHPFGASSKNNGSTWGAGVTLLDTTREGIGTGAVTVRAVRNEFAGVMGALDAVSCPAAYHNYQLSIFYAEDPTTRGARLHVENLTLARGRFGYELQLDGSRDGRYRFFGLGAGSKEVSESAYTNKELGGTLDLYWNFAENFRLSAGARARRVNLEDPARRLAAEKPSTLVRFREAPGLAGGSLAGERVTLVYDRRNQEFTPSRGTYARARAEFNQTSNDNGQALASRWGRFEFLLHQYWSTPDQRLTVVFRNRWELTTNQRKPIPFWEQPTLGGSETLRGFDTGRFYGQHSVFASLELRIQSLHMLAMGMPLDVELAPFLDGGQVFDQHGFHGPFNLNPGMSMRILNRPNIGLILNWAYGQDGSRLTGGVGLPF